MRDTHFKESLEGTRLADTAYKFCLIHLLPSDFVVPSAAHHPAILSLSVTLSMHRNFAWHSEQNPRGICPRAEVHGSACILLCRLVMFHVPICMSIIHHSFRGKGDVEFYT